MMKRITTAATAAIFAMGTAACDDSPTGSQGVTPAEVAGIYAVCGLTFDPEGDLLTQVNILTAGFELENEEVRAPQLQVDASGDFQILFTPREQFVERSLIGRFTTNGNHVNLSFTGGTASAPAYLLPGSLVLAFQETPKSLTTAATAQYDVARADYARLAGVSESGLADRIPGRLMVIFQAGSAGCS